MDILTRIKDLQEKIKSCDNNLKAIEMQGELVNLLKEILRDKDTLISLFNTKNINKL